MDIGRWDRARNKRLLRRYDLLFAKMEVLLEHHKNSDSVGFKTCTTKRDCVPATRKDMLNCNCRSYASMVKHKYALGNSII